MPELFGQHMWAEAETAAEGYMRELGFADAQVTRGTADGGVDVTSARAVAQSKYQGKPVGREPVQRIRGVAFDRAALFFSWSGYTAGAVEFATASGVALFDIPNGEPVAWSPAASELLDEVSEARELRREAAAAEVAARTEAARAAERETLESEQRIREADARSEAAKAEKEAAKARQRTVLTEQRAARRQQQADKRASRRAAVEQRRLANAPKVAARAEKRAYLASLPGYTRDTRLAVFVGIVGVAVPLGFGVFAGWFALRARTTLTRHGVERSPNLLRFAAMLSAIGISLAAMVVVGIPNGFSEEPSDLVSGLAALAGGLAGAGALVAWYTLPKKRIEQEREVWDPTS